MTKFTVPEMSCGHCKTAIEDAIAAIDSRAKVSVDLTAREVEVDSALAADTLISAMVAAGYEAAAIS